MSMKVPAEIAAAAVAAGEAKSKLPVKSMAVLGFLAGAYIAMGSCMMILVRQDAASVIGTGLSLLLGGAVFALGLFCVLCAGAELFTGNCLIPMAVAAGRASAAGMFRNLAVVLLANLAGALFFVFLVSASGIFSPAMQKLSITIAAGKVSLPTGQMFLRGVLCNWFVCLAVWLAFGAQDIISKFVTALLPVTAFVALGTEHNVANMFFIPAGMVFASSPAGAELAPELADKLTLGAFLGNIIPVTLGNIAGGMIFVAGLYWAAFGGAVMKALGDKK